LSKKYFTNPRRVNQTQLIEKAIKRREKRKFIASIVNKRVCEAVELWWRGAIHDYYSKRSWMCLPPPSEGLAKGYFERMYQVNELTSFDNLLASELMNPVNAASYSSNKMIKKGNRIDDDEDDFDGNNGAVASLYKNQNIASTNTLPIVKRISVAEQIDGFRIEDDVDLSPAPIGGGGLVYNSSSSNLTRGFEDAIDADVDSLGTLAASKGGGFQFGRYVREIGIKARTLVGGFLRKDDQVLLNSIPQEIFKKEGPSDSQWDWSKQDFSHANSMIYQNPGYSYTKYAEISNNNILMMEDMSCLTSPEEYANSIRECNIDVDDVAAMERLAVDGYISSIIPNGIYAGMERKESAVIAQGFISSSINMIENELQKSFDSNGYNLQEQNRVHLDTEENIVVSSPIQKETRSNVQRRGSKNDSTKRKGSYDFVPSYSKKHLKKLVSQAKSAPGLEDELLSNASQYIQQQAKYSNEIDIERLSKRISSLTVEKTILEYARILDKEIVASSVDDITFIASDDPQYQSFYELQSILHTLSPLKEMYSVKAKELRVKASKEVVVEENPKKKKYTNPLSMLSFKKYKAKTSGKKETTPAQTTSPSVSKDIEELYTMSSLAKSRISKDYEGFTSLAPDLYARISNPLLNMNEIAVIAWNRSQARKEDKK